MIGKDRPRSVRAHLIAFGAAVSLPLVVLLGVMLFHSVQLERSQLESRMLEVAANLADDVNREIDRRLATLQTLATSPSIVEKEWRYFYAQAAAATQGYGYIILVDDESRQIVNTFVPYGAEPPRDGNPESVRDAVKLKRPVVSNVFISLVTHKPVFNIRKSILDGAKVRYVLSLGMLAESLVPILKTERLPEGWGAAIRDRNDVVAAQLPEKDNFVSNKLPSNLVRQRVLGRVVETADQSGARILLTSALSENSGWRIDVYVPIALIEAPLRASLLAWSAASIFAILLALGLALLFARKLEVPLALAGKAAEQLGRGASFSPVRSGVIEANVVMDAMKGASEQLADRDRRQGLLLRELTHRVKNILAVVQAVVSRGLAGVSPDARDQVIARIHALSRAHDLLVQANWHGVRLTDIIAAELETYSDQVATSGPDLTIKGDVIQLFLLVLHELLTNAVKHGALSTRAGRVEVVWHIADDKDESRFVFRWQERGGPPVVPPPSRGFGSTLLETVISSTQGGTARLHFENLGFAYEFDAPLHSVAEDGAEDQEPATQQTVLR
jgi:two-component sensor histidine kinase